MDAEQPVQGAGLAVRPVHEGGQLGRGLPHQRQLAQRCGPHRHPGLGRDRCQRVPVSRLLLGRRAAAARLVRPGHRGGGLVEVADRDEVPRAVRAPAAVREQRHAAAGGQLQLEGAVDVHGRPWAPRGVGAGDQADGGVVVGGHGPILTEPPRHTSTRRGRFRAVFTSNTTANRPRTEACRTVPGRRQAAQGTRAVHSGVANLVRASCSASSRVASSSSTRRAP